MQRNMILKTLLNTLNPVYNIFENIVYYNRSAKSLVF